MTLPWRTSQLVISAWLGGYASQQDGAAQVRARFWHRGRCVGETFDLPAPYPRR